MVTLTGGQRTVLKRVSTAGAVAGLFSGKADPTGVPPGAPAGVAYLNENTGDIFQLGVDMDWLKIGNVKGPKGDSGDGVLSPAEIEAIAAEIEADITPPVDLTIAFENALAGP